MDIPLPTQMPTTPPPPAAEEEMVWAAQSQAMSGLFLRLLPVSLWWTQVLEIDAIGVNQLEIDTEPTP